MDSSAEWLMLGLNDAGPALEEALKAAGLDPDRLEPAGAWRVFKEFARQQALCDGEAVYVHIGMPDPADALIHVTFVRELAISDADGELEAVREIVCDLEYQPTPTVPRARVELADADFTDFDAFAAAVERHPDFQTFLRMRPVGSLVSWNEM
ncbi:MAG: hypothetical protein ABJD11_00030 [Gemmatimonadota bacterium]